MENATTSDLLMNTETPIPYADLVAMVNEFRDQLQSLDYRVTNKNFGSKIYQTKETITSKSRFIAGAGDEVVIMDAQHPTYRLWVGAADPTAAAFSVDKLGNVILSSATLAGYVPTGGALTDIGPGNITGTYISAGSITTPKLSATAIDGMTITGALVRTSSSGARVQMNSSTDALEVYDSSGVKRVLLDSDEITFINSGGATRGGIIANTTEVYLYALNGGNLQLESIGSGFTVLFKIAGSVSGYFSTAGLTLNNNLNLASGKINFDSVTSNPSGNGQMVYYKSGGTEGLRMQFGGSDFQFDATAV